MATRPPLTAPRIINNATSTLSYLTASVGLPVSRTSSLQTNVTKSIDYSECVLGVGDVQVLYFPEPRNSSSITSTSRIVTAVEGNYTFTSPSVYVVWSTVSAQIQDWLKGPPQTLAAYYNITKAYPPNVLMTVPGDCDYHGTNGRPWAPLNVNDLSDPPQNWIAAQGCFWQFQGGGTGPLGGVNPNGTEMAASPILSYPADIKTLDPSWVNCDANVYYWGAYDPPRALVPVSSLSAEAGPIYHTSVSQSEFHRPEFPTESVNPKVATYHISVATPWPKATMPVDVPAVSSVKKTAAPVASHTAGPDNSDPPPLIPESGVQGGDPWSLGDPKSDGSHGKVATEAPPATPVKVASAAAQPVYILPDGAVSVAGTTVKPGAPAITVAGTRISADANTLYVGGSRFPRPPSPATLNPPPSVISGHSLEVTNKGEVIVGDKVISTGSQTTLDGVRVSVGADRVVIDSSTYALPSTAASSGDKLPGEDFAEAESPIGTQPGDQIKAGAGGAIVVAGHTISQGQGTTIGGVYISVAPSLVVLGTKTFSNPLITTPPSTVSRLEREISYAGKVLTLPILQSEFLQTLFDPSSSAEGSLVSTGSSGAMVVNGKTFSSGYQATVSGNAISVGSGIVAVAGKTYAVPLPTDSAISRASDDAVVFDGQRLIPDTHTTISGTAISLGSNTLVVGDKTYALPLPSNTGASLASNGAVVFNGHSLITGTQTTVSGTVISLGSNILVIGGKTYARPLPTDAAVSLASNGAIMLDGLTLQEGQQTTIAGTPVSLGPNYVVVGGKTYALPRPTDAAVSLASDGAVVFNGVTLKNGERTTIDGTLVSLGSGYVVVGGTTYALPLPTDAAVSLASNGAVVFDGVTLTKGEQTTIDGTPVSLGPAYIVVDGTTYALPTRSSGPYRGNAQPTTTDPVAAYIASEFDYVSSAGKTGAVTGAPDLSPVASGSAKPDSEGAGVNSRRVGYSRWVYGATLILCILGTT